jgi:hypothetical protein
MEYLRGPLFLDVAAKGLSLVGILLMIFGQRGWFTVGVFAVALGVLFGAWSMIAVRRMGAPGRFPGAALFRSRPPKDDAGEGDGNP